MKHLYPVDLVVPYHSFSAFLYVRPANTAAICIFVLFSFFFSLFQHVSPLCLLFPHFLWPQKEIKGSLSLAFSFLLQAAEREAEDITGHMDPCGGALMTKWDAIPCYGAGGQQF